MTVYILIFLNRSVLVTVPVYGFKPALGKKNARLPSLVLTGLQF